MTINDILSYHEQGYFVQCTLGWEQGTPVFIIETLKNGKRKKGISYIDFEDAFAQLKRSDPI